MGNATKNRPSTTEAIQVGGQIEALSLIIESGDNGELWGSVDYGEDLLTAVGTSVEAVKAGIREQLSEFYDIDVVMSPPAFEVKYDLEAFFEKYSTLNMSAISILAGINPSLLRQYKSGVKYPSKDQVKKIEDAIHTLGQQLLDIALVVA